jgi:hypothetical protein
MQADPAHRRYRQAAVGDVCGAHRTLHRGAKLAGMSWFDAVCHAFATLSLGGFSTHDASVGHFESPLIEAVLIFFMLVAALNSLPIFWPSASAV